MQYWLIWLIAIIVFAIVEGISYQIISIWFAIGAVGAMIGAFLGFNLTVQLIIFFIISIICLVFTRPVFKKLLGNRIIKTNSDSLIGQTAIVIEEIDNIKSKGQAKINGNIWTARSLDNEVINKNVIVKVAKIEGVKLIVNKSEE